MHSQVIHEIENYDFDIKAPLNILFESDCGTRTPISFEDTFCFDENDRDDFSDLDAGWRSRRGKGGTLLFCHLGTSSKKILLSCAEQDVRTSNFFLIDP
jgi:hypothetical protein